MWERFFQDIFKHFGRTCGNVLGKAPTDDAMERASDESLFQSEFCFPMQISIAFSFQKGNDAKLAAPPFNR